MGKDHPEVTEIKNVCETSKKPKRVCRVVDQDKKKTSRKANKSE